MAARDWAAPLMAGSRKDGASCPSIEFGGSESARPVVARHARDKVNSRTRIDFIRRPPWQEVNTATRYLIGPQAPEGSYVKRACSRFLNPGGRKSPLPAGRRCPRRPGSRAWPRSFRSAGTDPAGPRSMCQDHSSHKGLLPNGKTAEVNPRAGGSAIFEAAVPGD